IKPFWPVPWLPLTLHIICSGSLSQCGLLCVGAHEPLFPPSPHPFLMVGKLKDECRHVKHISFPSWPDQQTPESAKPLLHLVSEVEEIQKAASPPGPIVVHCSAGIGRTGCFIATRIGCQQLKDKGEVDILGIVCQLRIDRGGMIQTSEQYQFLHHTLALYASQLPETTGP
uniref:protein-tyrosine-phosphatase n=1 Tax=Crocodylus porosus TaxID=8502 RepID=A0A7M4EEN5_CROPO